MNRLSLALRWRCLRWVVCAAAVPALWACSVRKLVAPVGGPRQVITNRFQQSVNRDLDLLFVVDDSPSMEPLQVKMAQRLPDFMNALKEVEGGLPNLHVAVISTSLAAGSLKPCKNDGGTFQHREACTALHAGSTFISSVADPNAPKGRANNFDGDIADVFACIAQLGQEGCGFEHQFASTMVALERARNPQDPYNGGFLRPGALLAIVMVTNEDDCSVPPDSTLFDPKVMRLADVSSQPGPLNGKALGVLQSYRCNEFGHRCGGQMLPHDVPATLTTMTDCVSAEDGVLITVNEFVTYLKGVKATPQQVLVAAIAGPPAPYVIGSATDPVEGGGPNETHPAVEHSCVQPTTDPMKPEFGDPAIRIKQWLDAFPGSVPPLSICADDFTGSMTQIAQAISKRIGAQCIEGDLMVKADMTTPDCDVTERVAGATPDASPVDKFVPFCAPGRAGADATHPCWELVASPRCMAGQMLQLCYDLACTAAARPTTTKVDALVACAIAP